MNTVDIIIIGAGPAGLSAAVNALSRGKTVRIFSNGDNFLSKAEQVDNHLGFYHVSGKELMDTFREHAQAESNGRSDPACLTGLLSSAAISG